ncbi:hypothetical protein CACET_c30950 [Clostridium aceticum]|uniref:SLH domain-containing protein n=2 Tax=Clostridium aceticum TaxID=84022 RepID=A0A0G3WGG9_9CLOT|nr:hypothetical protein CACET_c30950 [Clostridium aceticum]
MFFKKTGYTRTLLRILICFTIVLMNLSFNFQGVYAAAPYSRTISFDTPASTVDAGDTGQTSIQTTLMVEEVVFIDGGIEGFRVLEEGAQGDGRLVVVLDPHQDGLLQIAAHLEGMKDLNALHILSHGSMAEKRIGTTVLTAATLEEHAETLTRIGASLTAKGDILLYGCYVAQGEAGRAFIEDIARITQADVAASSDATGAATLGGNWVLEEATGEIGVSSLDLGEDYLGLLVAGTVRFTHGEGTTGDYYLGQVITDGTWGSADIPDIIYTFYFANTTNSPVGDIMITDYYMGEYDVSPGTILLWSSFHPADKFIIRSDASKKFRFSSVQLIDDGGTGGTITGYRNGSSVPVATHNFGYNEGYPQTVILGEDFSYVDEIHFTSSGWEYDNKLYIALNNFVFDNPIIPNTSPVINGSASVSLNDNATTTSFSTLSFTDNEGDGGTITITYPAANGTLSGTGLTGTAGNYTLSGANPTELTDRLQALVFTPTANQVAPASTVLTTFTLTPNDGQVNGTAVTATATVTSINDAPTDIILSNTTVTQSGGGNAVVGTLSTVDPDAGDSHAYALVAGVGDTNNALFNISGSSLRVNNAASMAGSYAVRIRSTDAGGLWFEQSFAITVIDDVPPVFSVSPTTANITDSGFELSATLNEAGTLFYIVVARDATAPTSVQVVEGEGYEGVTVVTAGSHVSTDAPFAHTFTVDGLTMATEYDIYMVGRDVANNLMGSPSVIGVTTADNTPILEGIVGAVSWQENTASGSSLSGDAIYLFSDASITSVESSFNGAILTVSFSDGYQNGDMISFNGTADTTVGTLTYNDVVTPGELSMDGQVIATVTGGFEMVLVVTFTDQASAEQVNAVLNHVTFTVIGNDNPTNFGDNANRTVSAVFEDTGGLSSAPLAGTLGLIPYNDPEILTGTIGGTFIGGTGNALLLVSDASLTQVDNVNLDGGSLTVSLAAYQDGDALGVATGNGISLVGGQNIQHVGVHFATIHAVANGMNGQALTLGFNNNATHARVQALIRQLVFESSSQNPTNFRTAISRSVNITLDDGAGGTTATSELNGIITIDDNNDAPEVDLNGGEFGEDSTVIFSVEGSAVSIAPDATIIDWDSTHLTSMTVTLTNRPNGANESLGLSASAMAAASGAGLSASYTAPTGNLSIIGHASVEVYQTILRGIQYHNIVTAMSVDTTDRVITVTVSDGEDTSIPRTATVSLVTAPVIGGLSGTPIAHIEGGGAVLIAGDATIVEPDGDNLNRLVITLTNPQNGADEVLTLLGGSGVRGAITVTYTSNSIITMTGVASATEYQALLRELQYSNTSSVPEIATLREITIQGRDVGNNEGNSATVRVQPATTPSVTSITRTGASVTNASTVNYTVTFSESVTGVAVGDFSVITTGTITGASVTEVNGSGSTWTVTINTGTGDGTIRLDLMDNDSITATSSGIPLGGAGAGNGNFTSGEVYTIDRTPPVINAVSIPNTGMKVGDTVTVTITVASDTDTYTLTSGTVGGFALSNLNKTNDTTYTAQFTVTEGGTDVGAEEGIPVSIVLGDTVGNENSAYTTPISQTNDPINANSPTEIILTPASIGVAATGINAQVGSFSTTDASPVDTFTYTLVSGAGDTHNGSFNINGSNLRTNTALTAGNYDIRVRVTDSDGNSFEKSFAITVATMFTITYDGNGSTGGTVPTDSSSYIENATVTVLGNTGSLIRTGYTFGGWNTAADGKGTNYAPGNTFTIGSSNVTLYTQWIPNPTYTVTYDGNGSTGGTVPTDSNSYEENAIATVLGNTGNLIKIGYTFGGWNTAADGNGTNYSAGSTFTMGSENITLYAKWIDSSSIRMTASPDNVRGNINFNQTFILSVYNDTVTGSVYASDINLGGAFNTLNLDLVDNSSNTVTLAVYGSLNTQGIGTISINQSKLNHSTTPLTAEVVVSLNNINYHGNGSTGGSVPTDSNAYPEGAIVTVRENTGNLVKTGYTFRGWNTQANGQGSSYTQGSTLIMSTTNLNLYAMWTKISSGGGSSGGGTTTAPTPTPAPTPTTTTETQAIVIVNGQEQNIGKETKTTEDGKSTVTVEVDNKIIESKIDEAIKNNTTGMGNIIQVLVADAKSEVIKVELTGDIVKKLEENTFNVSVKHDNIEYIIPAEEFTISKVAENLGIKETNLTDIKVEIKITKLDEKVVEKYSEVVKANGAELVFPPVSFEVVAKTTRADGRTDELQISRFSNYVERVMEIPAGLDPSKITTGIVFNPDGTYSHIPTSIYQKDGKWYAKLNSLTNSAYSVIRNPVTVASVASHWSKDAVNDMASRLVVFNPDSFSPDKAITRADFAEYIVRALGLYREGPTHGNKFSDVSAAGDRTLAILIASEYGIVAGYPDGTFRPDSLITREEAMTMYQKAMKITKLVGRDENRYQNYTDYNQVGSWATSYVKEVLSAYVFSGTTSTTISPKANLTYAEAAQAIKNLLVESKLINK